MKNRKKKNCDSDYTEEAKESEYNDRWGPKGKIQYLLVLTACSSLVNK